MYTNGILYQKYIFLVWLAHEAFTKKKNNCKGLYSELVKSIKGFFFLFQKKTFLRKEENVFSTESLRQVFYSIYFIALPFFFLRQRKSTSKGNIEGGEKKCIARKNLHSIRLPRRNDFSLSNRI